MKLIPDPVPLVDPARRLVLFTNGKCGGTTLKSWFFANLDLPGFEANPLRFAMTFGPKFVYSHFNSGRKLTPRAGQATDPEQVRRMTIFYRRAFCAPAVASGRTAGFFKFAVVRNPEDRAVSAFLDKFCGDNRDTSWVRTAAAAAHPDSDPSFMDFLAYIDCVDEAACDPHWRRQSYVLDARVLDAFVRLEHLAEDFRAIADRVGDAHFGKLELKLKRNLSAIDAAAAPPVGDMTGLRASEIAAWRAARGYFPPKDALVTDVSRAQIRRAYARDYALLPYKD